MQQFFQIAKYWTITEIFNTILPHLPGWELTASTVEAQIPSGNGPGYSVGGQVQYFVTMDHLYEIQILDQFFLHLVADLGVSYQTLQQAFDVPGVTGTILTEFYDNLATYQNPEIVGMDDRINQMKAKIWQSTGPNNMHSPLNINRGPFIWTIDQNKDQLALFAITLALMNDDRVKPIFHMTNKRIHQALTNINQDWADAYKSWLITKINQRSADIQNAAQRVINLIPTSPAHPHAARFPQEVSRWSAFMSSLLATYPVASMTIPSVACDTVAEATGVFANVSIATDTSRPLKAGGSTHDVFRKVRLRGHGIQTRQYPTITAAPV